ncbi:MAG: BREX-3 system P-loop-containing protein BrxF [Mesorhizobium sp.]|nr:MAG: BREX-3 system P-loop-containing protein BrxF [Mesorhizobium sp.]
MASVEIDQLDALVSEIGFLNSKLLLLIGGPGAGKSRLIAELSKRRSVPVLNVGASLGAVLLLKPTVRRRVEAANLLRELADRSAIHNLLLLDNLELLFDRTLELNPIDLLKRLAHARSVVAVWPGDLQNGRLSYGAAAHPEHRDYGVEGLVPFIIH